jgi:hypothetical protein
MVDQTVSAPRTGLPLRDRDLDHDNNESVRLVWSKVSWAPVFAAAVAGISVQLLFTVLGMAVGISAAGADITGRPDGEAISTMAGAWWLISGTVALLIAGAVYGRLASLPRSNELLFHAFIMWGLTAIFGFAVLWSASTLGSISGSVAASRVGLNSTVLSGAAPGVGAAPALRTPTDRDDGLARDTAGRDAAIEGRLTPVAEQTRRYVRNAAWWSVIGLCLGIIASLAGAWWAATDVIIKKPPINA